MLDRNLQDILVCPVSKTSLIWDERNEELLCKVSGLAYPVRDGIPVLLEDAARRLSDEELKALQPG